MGTPWKRPRRSCIGLPGSAGSWPGGRSSTRTATLRIRLRNSFGRESSTSSTSLVNSSRFMGPTTQSTIEPSNETGNPKLETHYSCNPSPYDSDRICPATAHRTASRDRPHQAPEQDRRRHAGVLHREALYDANHRRLDVVARRQADRVHLQYQRTQQSLAGAGEWGMADAVDHQRSAAVAAGVVARRDLDRIHLRPRWR